MPVDVAGCFSVGVVRTRENDCLISRKELPEPDEAELVAEKDDAGLANAPGRGLVSA